MLAYHFELNETFDDLRIENELSNAKRAICNYYEIEDENIELTESIANKIFNGRQGAFRKYNIVKGGQAVEILEMYFTNERDYLTIYTSPLN